MTQEPDHFRAFGLPRAYVIDMAALDAAYEKHSFEVHPDFFAAAAPEEKQRAQRAAAELNEGYRILRSDGERAGYLLGLLAHGKALDTRQLPPGFLQEMFALQEEVDDLEAQPSPERKTQVREEVAARLARVRAARPPLFEQALAEPTPELLQAIQSNLNCEKYLLRLEARLV